MDGPADVVPLRFFSDLPDPRAANVRHRLIDLLVMALCATLCGADGWDDFEDFADAKRDWFCSVVNRFGFDMTCSPFGAGYGR